MSDRTPKPSGTDEELLLAHKIHDIMLNVKILSATPDDATKVVMQLIQADRERLYGELVAKADDKCNGFGKVVMLDDINKVFNREGADNE